MGAPRNRLRHKTRLDASGDYGAHERGSGPWLLAAEVFDRGGWDGRGDELEMKESRTIFRRILDVAGRATSNNVVGAVTALRPVVAHESLQSTSIALAAQLNSVR